MRNEIRRTVGAALLLLLATTGCGSDQPALRVGAASFTEEELLGLDAERVWRLAELTALGLAYAGEEVPALGRPLLDRRIESRLLERFRAELAVRRAGVEEDVLRAHYATDPEYELVVRHVVALAEENAPRSARDSARRTARRALERIRSGEDFARVAAELSEEPGAAERGGRLEPGRVGSWVPAFWEAASSLEEGEVSDVVRSPYGYHVIRLEERRVVPFVEVRGRVMMEAASMIGGAEEAWKAWRDSVAPGLRVDTAAVERAALDALPDTAPVVTWPGGAYSARSFRSHLTSLPLDRWREASTGTGPAALREATSDGLRARASRRAREMDLEVPRAERSEVERQWRDRVMRWATSLGFEIGMASSRVAEAARDGLTTTRQNARIARRETRERGPLLRAAYPIGGSAVPETGGGASP